MRSPEDRPSFERLPGEFAKCHHAFAHYRDLGPTRSLDAAWHAHQRACVGVEQPAHRRRPMRWGDWSVAWSWVERAAAFDQHAEALRRAAFEQEQIDAGRRQARTLAAALAALAVPLRIALAVASADDLDVLIAAAARSPESRRQALSDAARVAALLPNVVAAERIVLGLSSTAYQIVHEVAAGDALATAITGSPELTAAAVQFLDAVSQKTLAPPPPRASDLPPPEAA